MGQKRELLERLLASRTPSARRFPLSFAQRRLWFLAELDPSDPAYNLLNAYRLLGRLDVAALAASAGEIVRRHGALRTTFTFDGEEPEQVVAPSATAVFHSIDLRGLDPVRRWREAHRVTSRAARTPYDLARGPLYRFLLLRLAAEESVLLVMMHHIIGDIWSFKVINQELQTLYGAATAGRPSPLLPLPLQYGEFAAWDRNPARTAALEPQVAYWRRQLAGLQPLEIPPDRPRPALQTSHGAASALRLPKDLAERLAGTAAELGVSAYMLSLTVFLALLGRVTGRDDLSCGSPIANRHRSELELLVGFFVNTLVMRTDASGNPTFGELAARVRATAVEAYSHPEAPFERLVEELDVVRDLSRNPLYQVTFQHGFLPPLELSGLATSTCFLLDYGVARADLEIHLLDDGDGLQAVGVYNTDLFDRTTVVRLLDHFGDLLRGAVERPADRLAALSWLRAAERAQVLREWNDTATDEAAPTLHERFAAWAERRPDAVAVEFPAGCWTYGELAEKVVVLARHLRSLGVGPEAIVGLYMERRPELVLGALGILSAGGAFLPLDAAYPQERLAFMLESSAAPVLLTLSELAGSLPPGTCRIVCLDTEWEAITRQGGGPARVHPDPDSPAYVIYTSGSTGRPKGVAVLHRGLANLAAWQASVFATRVGSRVLQFASPSFDASVWEIAMALGAGASIRLAPARDLLPSPELAHRLRQWGTTHATLPPSALAIMNDADLPDLACLVVAGEACPQSLADLWVAGRRFFDAYGPTEGTVCATIQEHRAGNRLTIGRPIANAETLVLDAGLREVGIGVPAELCFGGQLLARGYLGRPELTAERFVPHPHAAKPGARLYRTGDLVRWLPDGRIEFLGRIDQQVKVRGFRIEVGEIEAVLLGHPAVREAAVTVWEPRSGDRRLVAYVALRSEPAVDTGELRRHLRAKLPEFMVPAAVVTLPALPLTGNGKVDRRALPAPVSLAVESGVSYVAPAAGLEEQIAQLWRELLLVERIGAQDNFFDLGGNSMLMALLRRELQKRFEKEISLVDMFRHATVRSMTGFLARGEDQAAVTGGVDRGEQRRTAAERRRQMRGGLRSAPPGEGV